MAKKQKVLSPEKAAKRLEKDRKLLEKSKKQLERPKNTWGYLLIVAGTLMLIQLLDVVATSAGSYIQSSVLNEFLIMGKGLSENQALQYASLVGIITLLMALISPFYKVLADKFGRRAILIINALGMTIGFFIEFISPTYMMFVVGQTILAFFIIHDTQFLYVQEVAPKKHRAKIQGALEFVGEIGILFIPMLRGLFLDADGGNWRPVLLVPGIAGIIIVIVGFAFIRESDVFLKSQVQRLEKKLSGIESNPQENVVVEKETGIGPAFKYIKKDKQLKKLTIAGFFLMLSSVGIINSNEAFMSFSGMSVAAVTTALFFLPLAQSTLTLTKGFLSDLIGRKGTIVVCFIINIAAQILFVAGTSIGWSPWLVGVVGGLAFGSIWGGMLGQNTLMLSETSPTKLRGSIIGAAGLVQMSGMVLGFLLNAVLLGFLSIATVRLSIGLPFIIVFFIINMTGTRETKGTDLEKVAEIQ